MVRECGRWPVQLREYEQTTTPGIRPRGGLLGGTALECHTSVLPDAFQYVGCRAYFCTFFHASSRRLRKISRTHTHGGTMSYPEAPAPAEPSTLARLLAEAFGTFLLVFGLVG